MRYFKYILILTCLWSTAFAQQADSVLTLQQCIDIAIKNNLTVHKSELQMETDRIYWKQARENMLPTLNGNIDHTINNGRSQNADLTYVNSQITNANYNLSSNLVLFNGLSLVNSIKQTSLAYQAGKMDYQQAKNDISLNVITTYLQVLDNEDQFAQAKTQLEVSNKQLERNEILNKEGNIAPQTLYDLRGTAANDKLNIINTRNAIYAAKLNLLQIMNVPFNKEVKLARLNATELPGLYAQTSAQVYSNAINDLALVKAAELRVQSAEKGVRVASGNLYPTLSFNGGVNTQYSSGSRGSYSDQFRGNYSNGLGIGLSIPILNAFRSRNRVSLAKIVLQDAKYTNDATKIQLKQNVEQAYVNMTSAYERYQVLGDQVAAYAESFRIAEVRFNEGDLNSVDYLVAKGNLDRAKTGLINARYDYFIRTKILDYYQGKLAL
ncbi:TolC family protein [Mucilaginibacter boryungensis]|uniref:TolC family protein n=1 Tax=Mucilaginibacter boryungensis TaxID=768480 RepID=A0ABR9XHB7_9SPHI|nr:TolC family protein [Mucilaginibacter boryungensis]MBE9666459.1 TolC family protein [Mucilaginibacter boryungensis]